MRIDNIGERFDPRKAMRKQSFSELIKSSWEQTKVILFRPFQVKKWLLLLFIVFMAGQLAGGCNPSLNLPGPTKPKVEEKAPEASTTNPELANPEVANPEVANPEAKVPTTPPLLEKFKARTKEVLENKRLLAIYGAIALVLFLLCLGLSVLWIWLSARFSFILIESVVRNDASIKRPFRANRKEGNSLFLWNLAICALSFLVLALIVAGAIFSLSKAGVFAEGAKPGAGKIFLMVLPYGIGFILLTLVGLLINFSVVNFIQPIMYRDKIRILAAWRQFFLILGKNVGDFLLYILVKLGLLILAGIAMGIITFIVTLGLLIPIGLIALICFLIFKILPKVLQPVFFVLLVLIGVPLFIALLIFTNCVILPVPIFFRIFSIKFLGSLEDRYNLYEGAFVAEL